MENDRVQPDFSVRVRLGEEEILMNRVYDHVHVFPWLGHGILKIIEQDGFKQWHTDEATARKVAEAVGIVVIEREEISEVEYRGYGNAILSMMEDTTEWDIEDGQV